MVGTRSARKSRGGGGGEAPRMHELQMPNLGDGFGAPVGADHSIPSGAPPMSGLQGNGEMQGGMISLADLAVPAVLIGTKYALPGASRTAKKAANSRAVSRVASTVKGVAGRAVKAVAASSKKPAAKKTAAEKPAAKKTAAKKTAAEKPAAKKPAAKKPAAKKPASKGDGR